MLAKQLAIDPLPGGADADYAAGLFIGRFKGYDIISHTGQTAGYVGVVESRPALKLSIAWLSNTTEFSDSLFVGITAIDNLFVKDAPPETLAKPIKNVVISPIDIKKHVGWFRYTATNRGVNINLRNDTLWLNSAPLIPMNETSFRFKESAIEFNKSGGFTLTTTDKARIAFTKANLAEITPNYLKAFAGTYYSKETESSFEIIFKGGKLMLEQNYLKDVVLLPTYKNAFNFELNVDSDIAPVSGNILFEKNNKKAGITCEISMNDARKIEFVKIQ